MDAENAALGPYAERFVVARPVGDEQWESGAPESKGNRVDGTAPHTRARARPPFSRAFARSHRALGSGDAVPDAARRCRRCALRGEKKHGARSADACV
eukprot:7376970-Prymnesium_polylepis.1